MYRLISKYPDRRVKRCYDTLQQAASAYGRFVRIQPMYEHKLYEKKGRKPIRSHFPPRRMVWDDIKPRRK